MRPAIGSFAKPGSCLLGSPFQQPFDEQPQVALRSRSAGNLQDGHGEPVEQVFTEGARRDLVGQVSVGRSDDSDIHLDRFGLADAGDFALLEGAKELHLCVEGELAKLIEEQRAAIGGLEVRRGGALRVRERALLVAE